MELLVVVAIIGLLASVVYVAVNDARAKSRDAYRVRTLQELSKALELYYTAHDSYPIFGAIQTGATVDCGGGSWGASAQWCSFLSFLSPYYGGGVLDPLGKSSAYAFYYDADSGDNGQSFGLMVTLETDAAANVYNGDGGMYCKAVGGGSVSCANPTIAGFELGTQPAYCQSKYGSGNWRGGNTVCSVGN